MHTFYNSYCNHPTHIFITIRIQRYIYVWKYIYIWTQLQLHAPQKNKNTSYLYLNINSIRIAILRINTPVSSPISHGNSFTQASRWSAIRSGFRQRYLNSNLSEAFLFWGRDECLHMLNLAIWPGEEAIPIILFTYSFQSFDSGHAGAAPSMQNTTDVENIWCLCSWFTCGFVVPFSVETRGLLLWQLLFCLGESCV